MALKGHRRKAKKRSGSRRRWSKRVHGGCKYGKLKHPRGRRICRRRPK